MNANRFPPETSIRIKKLRKAGFVLADDATTFDAWKCRQILQRREVGLRDDASYREYFEHVHHFGVAHGGAWEEHCADLHISGVGTAEQYNILKRCRSGEVLNLTREPNTEHFMAVSVRRMNSDLLGYIPSGFYSVAEEMDGGALFAAIFRTISAKIGDTRTYFELSEGQLIGDVINSYRMNPGRKFLSTLMASVDVHQFHAPRPCLTN